ncbi:Gfo/Idh/MocA family protein [Sphingobacterium yanglingense]|uniref:Secreted protein n=1 Tax=Sphingobacterium yanglingense TaxID=1437280 RepID=A0A4R6WFP3_9SPHI|nr:Gfo/Idh/MocA family oxidoreductase [Sphingobacterium yanglingense]TDQ77132.1 secreted protein [Sphingobacterium yanglingense]
MDNNSRRDFLKKTLIASTAVGLGGILPGFSAKSYNRIVGANEKMRVSVMGVNSRGAALAQNFASQAQSEVIHVCDVDSRAIDKCKEGLAKFQKTTVTGFKDFRKSLESKDVDIFVVAAPDHWHAPAAILASQAGKSVYLEKPCSHNPREGELLIAAANKYGNVIQMGNQRRSWPNVVKGIEEVHNGTIGKVFYAKTWYTNNRPSIGIGKKTAVPSWLDFDLWQGPAPRAAFQDNLLHYNWHWFWNWGTGEALNNGTHMVDLARWGLQVDYPTRVSSNGGRYAYQDDWQTPDTQVISLEFGPDKMITWEGRSCNAMTTEGSNVGVMFYGSKGSLQIDGANSYKLFDIQGKLVKEVKDSGPINTASLSSPSQQLDALHMQNMFAAIKNNGNLNSDILSGHKSTLLVQLGNIALRAGKQLEINSQNGHILNDSDAMKNLWSREYAKGWEPKV